MDNKDIIFNNIVNEILKEPKTDNYTTLTLMTPEGNIECRFYQTNSKLGTIYVGGVGIGFDTPANGFILI